jgi:hypothetical protein
MNAGAWQPATVIHSTGRAADGLLMVDATFGGGNVALQQQSPSGAWLPLNAEGSTTADLADRERYRQLRAPAGQIRVHHHRHGVNAYAVGIPTNNAG